MKKKTIVSLIGCSFALAFGAFTGLKLGQNEINEAKATTAKTFYLDCTGHDYDTYDSICLHLWGNDKGDWYYQASRAGDNYWSVTVPDIDGFAGCEFYKCNYVWEGNRGAENLYNKQSWLTFPSSNFYYTVTQDSHGSNDNDKNWSAPVAWSLTGDSSATLSSTKFDADGYQYYSESVTLAENAVIEFTNGTLTTGYADLRDVGNGQTAKEKNQVVDDGTGKVKVVFGGTYEIYVNAVTGKVWMQTDRVTEIKHFAQEFNTAMATPCADENANNQSAVSAIWNTWKGNFEALTEGARQEFGTSNDSDVVQARKLYLHCVSKYGLTAWTGAPQASNIVNPLAIEANAVNTAVIIIVISTISLVGLGAFFFIKRKKEN